VAKQKNKWHYYWHKMNGQCPTYTRKQDYNQLIMKALLQKENHGVIHASLMGLKRYLLMENVTRMVGSIGCTNQRESSIGEEHRIISEIITARLWFMMVLILLILFKESLLIVISWQLLLVLRKMKRKINICN